jgi:stage II sporulation protein D
MTSPVLRRALSAVAALAIAVVVPAVTTGSGGGAQATPRPVPAAMRSHALHTPAPSASPAPGRTTGSAAADADAAAVSDEVALDGRAHVVGVSWPRGSVARSAVVELRERRGTRWGAWEAMESETSEGPDPGSTTDLGSRGGTAPYISTADAVQVRVVGGSAARARTARLDVVDATVTAADEQVVAAPAGSATAAATRPTIYTRADWGADESIRHAIVAEGTIRTAVIHHTAGSNSYTAADVPSIIRGIYVFHTDGRGWGDIGYNFLVDRYGHTWEGRWGGVTKPMVGAHTAGYNSQTFGVSVLGEFTTAAVPSAVTTALAKLVAWKLGLTGIDPTAKTTIDGAGTRPTVIGHRDLNSTTCPGDQLYARLPTVRTTAKQYQGTAAVAADSTTWTLSGAGYGHGVGMSQYGAMEMAKGGSTAADILGHYYSGTDYTAVDDRAVLNVNLLHGAGSVTVKVTQLASGSRGMRITAGGAAMTAPPGSTATATRSGTDVTVTCPACSPTTTLTGRSASVTWDDDRTLLDVGGTSYRDGYLRLIATPSASTLEAVARVRIHDQYLDYVREMPWSWPGAALEAQAAAARGIALSAYEAGLTSACACHVYDTTASQVFGGYPTGTEAGQWAAWRAAVRATGSSSTGYVVTYGGSIISSVYSSSSGGRTQNSEDVWTSAVPYLRSVDDHWGIRSSNPNYRWLSRPDKGALASAFGLGDVARLDLSARYRSGAVATATATAADGSTASLSGATFASRLGLKSSYVRRPVTRYSGTTPYAVAAAVAKVNRTSASTVVIASGEDKARAAAAVTGPLAQALKAPLLLTKASGLPSSTRSELSRRSGALTSAVVVGGPALVSSTVVDQLKARGLSVTRISGADRYALSAAVARRIAKVHAVDTAVVASGSVLADAVAAGGPAGRLGEPVLLTKSGALPSSVSSALGDLGVSTVRVVGSTTSVSTAVEDALRVDASRVDRIDGASRWTVAANVATFYRPLLPSATRAVLVGGDDTVLASALSVGSLGHLTLYVTPTSLPAQSRYVLQHSGDVGRLLVVGSTSTVRVSVTVLAMRA